MEIYTIGFTQKSAEQFFEKLRASGIQRLIDIRLNNTSQLAGFAKRLDLEYFLKRICGIEYVHLPELAPTDDILRAYKKKLIDWQEYEARFCTLLEQRQVDKTVDRKLFEQKSVLLCSEPKADRCHRRLVAEYLKRHWNDVEIKHL